jgi:hypothetical protein
MLENIRILIRGLEADLFFRKNDENEKRIMTRGKCGGSISPILMGVDDGERKRSNACKTEENKGQLCVASISFFKKSIKLQPWLNN